MAKIGINLATGSIQQDEIIVGIDLGTTNSLIAIIDPATGKPVVLKEFDHTALVPSVIHFDAIGNIEVGDLARQKLETHPERTIFSAKRLMGKSYAEMHDAGMDYAYRIIADDTDRMVKVQVDDRFYTPVELSSFILRELKKRAEHILKTPVNKAVITVPAYFNDAQRQATRDAGKLAGLDVLRIINEPTAASLAYGLGNNNEAMETIVVYDLGGGTFDVSVLRIVEGVFEVLSTNGDTHLGGDDFDKAIMEHWLGNEQLNISKENPSVRQAIRLKAEQAKIHLSTHDFFEEQWGDITLKITRNEFESIITKLMDRTMQSVKMALKDAGLTPQEIETIVMVGGSTRIPALKSTVSQYFGKTVHDNLDPDEVVALGAAIQADVMAGNNKETLLLDITPLSLGIETAGGLMDVMIPRNSKIPSRASRQYTTQVDGQSSMRISVFQGERDLVKDNRKLAEFNLKGIPGMPAGLPKVEIRFLINADGILVVNAMELRSGVSQQIEVNHRKDMTDVDVERMLMDSITHAQEDILLRALAEARTEGEQLLQTTEKFLEKRAASLTQQELMDTAHAMQALQLAITMEDKNLIQQKIESLNDISRPYAERIMDEAVAEAMKGRRV
jgi:molecular chaperone HscA